MARSMPFKSYGAFKRILPDGLCALVCFVFLQASFLVLTYYSFFDQVGRITTPGYIPTESDVLRARTKTTGIYETHFTMDHLSIQ